MAQLFRIQDLQSGPGENGAMNVYWLDNPSGSDKPMLAVGTAFAQQMVEIIRFIQGHDWEHTALLITNVLNGLTALFNLTGFGGGRSSDSTPASNAWSYSIKPIGPTLKRGGKRITGVGEDDSGNEVAGAAMAAILQALTPAFYAPIPVDGVNMKLATVRPVGSPVTSYIVSPNQSAIYRAIGTQVTRKLGRGGLATSLAFNPHETHSLSGASLAGLSTDPDDWVDSIDAVVDPRVALITANEEHTIVV